MNQDIAFDTHRFIKHLTATGFTEQQAEALADEQVQFLNTNLATKADTGRIEADIAATNERIAQVEANLKVDIARVETDLKANIAQVEANLKVDIAETKVEIIKWMVGTVLAAAILQTTLIGLLLTGVS